jgi:hypothetical protein
VGIIFGSYFLDAMSKVTEAVEWLGYASPFHYLRFSVNDPKYSVSIPGAIFLLLLGGGVLFFAYRSYRKKDVHG